VNFQKYQSSYEMVQFSQIKGKGIIVPSRSEIKLIQQEFIKMIRSDDFAAYERAQINKYDDLLYEYWKSQDKRPRME